MDNKKLTEKDEKTLIRALTYYHEKYVCCELKKEDEDAANKEDFALRELRKHLGLQFSLTL